MSFDERMKRELEKEAHDIDEILAEDQGLFDMLFASFKGGMRRWLIIVNILTIVASIFMVWCGYEFFVATEIQEQVFWGVCVLILLNMQIGLKQWLWMEVNRNSVMREIKRVELVIGNLASKLSQ
ncbi:DUF6768 family protein [Aliikangiella coralliicola]|uniref:Uncharacterized protein n=1 Tax=Aliikangiella coralliicola TaxID=2592383 RepID=A0A545UFR6_9GAMM|nr:DUF6768 family protein [Aliikangiella coralliicola]TQV88310.1 hypothetical protein FLL46_07225 [Aliikangiella coralliicola]